MITGIFFALGACFIWGLIFVVPEFMNGFDALEVALGRYLVYGIISCLLFFKARTQGTCRYPKHVWVKVLSLSLGFCVGYYPFIVLALRYSTPAICALIIGISPITIAFYGNWKQREVSFRSLILPSVLILVGLLIINLPHIETSGSLSTYALGLLCALVALISWSWYVVANSRFLKNHPEVSSSDWSTLFGVTTLFWAIVMGAIYGAFAGVDTVKYLSWSNELLRFIVGCGILGIFCSWVGAYFWNKASVYLPVSLAGNYPSLKRSSAFYSTISLHKGFRPCLRALV